MGDVDRREFRKKKFHRDKEDKSWPTTTPVLLSKYDNEKDYKIRSADISKLHMLGDVSSQQTIILKTRDGETRALSPNIVHQVTATPKPKRESDLYNDAVKTKTLLPKPLANPPNGLRKVPFMKSSMCLIDDGVFMGDGILDYLTDQNEYLVVGCLGLQGVGKSTVMSRLCGYIEEKNKDVFKAQTFENLVTCSHCTSTVDLFVSKNRILFLDTPPILSPSLMDKIIYQESKKNTFNPSSGQSFIVSSQMLGNDISNTESALEITSLQIAAFVMSVCHVVILVQDWFYDPNVLRFLQTAEMLKPPMPTTSHNEELIEYFPHLVFLQTKATYSDFTQDNINVMQDAYTQTFLRSRLLIQSGIGIANHLNTCSSIEPINLYILPDLDLEGEQDCVNGHPGFDYLMEKLKRDIYGIPKNPLTHAPLSEKNWSLHYIIPYGRTAGGSSLIMCVVVLHVRDL